MKTPDSERGDRIETVIYAMVGFLFCLGQALMLLSQSHSDERRFVYIGLPLAAIFVAIIMLAWFKHPFPRVPIRVICGAAACLAGIAAWALIAAGMVDSKLSTTYVGLPVLMFVFVVAGTIPRSVRIRRRRSPNE